jgi:hypothetical protein
MAGVLAVVAVSCSAGPVQTAAGLEPGVHVDPGSPAAKEYALPLNQARQTGEVAATHESSSASVPFGAGIKPPGASGPSHPGSGAARAVGRGGASGSAGANTASRQSTLPSAVLSASSSRAGSRDDGSILALLAGGVAILILGGFGGTVLRRSRHSTHSA